MKNLKNLFLIGLAVLAISLAGCPTDGDDSSSPSPSTGLDLPAISEPTTGQAAIKLTSVDLEGDIPNETLTGSGDGYSFSVAGGKLNLTLNTPSNPVVGKDTGYINKNLLGGSPPDAEFAETVVPDDAKFSIPSFSGTVGGQNYYYLRRFKGETDKETYSISSEILYVYVDKDCTITRDEKSWPETDDDGKTWPLKCNAVNLSLKKGWNLVQIDDNSTRELLTRTMKIASQNVPWYISTYK